MNSALKQKGKTRFSIEFERHWLESFIGIFRKSEECKGSFKGAFVVMFYAPKLL